MLFVAVFGITKKRRWSNGYQRRLKGITMKRNIKIKKCYRIVKKNIFSRENTFSFLKLLVDCLQKTRLFDEVPINKIDYHSSKKAVGASKERIHIVHQ